MGDLSNNMKKIGEIQVQSLHPVEQDEIQSQEITGNKTRINTVLDKDIWATVFRGDEGTLWGMIYFISATNTFNKHIYHVMKHINEQQRPNWKNKEQKNDYYDQPKRKIYIPRPSEKMEKILETIPTTIHYKEIHRDARKIKHYTLNKGYYNVKITRNNLEWKEVKKHELAKAI